MKAKKATPNLNSHNQRLYVAFSYAKLLELFIQQQQAALDNGIIERKIPIGQLRQFAVRCETFVRSHLIDIDTVDKAKKAAARFKQHFNGDAFFFTRCLSSDAASFSLLERIAYLQAKPTKAQPDSASRTRLMTNEETVIAKKLMVENLGIVGRSWVNPRLTAGLVILPEGYHAVKNASVKIHNTERETLVARAMMQRLAGQGYERVLDGCDTVRMQHKKDGALAFVFARDGVFVEAFKESLTSVFWGI